MEQKSNPKFRSLPHKCLVTGEGGAVEAVLKWSEQS
jgi:hypothetical protein